MKKLEGLEGYERKMLARLAKQELARRKYIDFLEYAHPEYIRTKFNQYIAMKIDELVEKRGKRLMIFMPPRHGKSMTISKSLPAYYLMHNPTHEVMITSYGYELSVDFGKSNRDIFSENAPDLYGLYVNPDKKSAQGWEVRDHGGRCTATSILGSATGKGADLLIVDDPIKNEDDVNSAEKRDKLYSHYLSTFTTRLHGEKANIVVILTRWHDDDLAGRILYESEQQKKAGLPYDDWEVISFPALATGDDILGREEGQPLWPEKYDKELMEKTKSIVGSKIWSSLYQQSPVVEDGDIFKYDDFQRYTDLPEKFEWVIQSWDTSFKNTINSDYVVGQVWGKSGSKFYMIYQIRGRYTFNQTKDLIIATKKAFPIARAILIEESANGHAIINELESTIPGIIPIKARDSKESRARAVTPYVEAHNVYLPKDSTGDMILDEATRFPSAKHDDQVDAMTQALNYYRDRDVQVQTFNKSILGLR